MLSKENAVVWAKVPKPLKARIVALKSLDPAIFSESRVTAQCLAAHLPIIEANAKSFLNPIHETPSKRRRKLASV